MNHHFTIGRAAQETGLSAPTIRYYEQTGLVPPPARGESGYRLYSQDDLTRLHFAKRARLLGLSLEEARDIMTYALDGCCGSLQQHLASLLEVKIAEAEERIRELSNLKADLEALHQSLADQSQRPVDVSQPTGSAFCACLDEPAR
jgi:DNA-binding transcriptional MerR regulator